MPAADQTKNVKRGKGVITMPTVLVPRGIFPLPSLNPYITSAISEKVLTAKKEALKRVPTPHPLKGIFLEDKAWKPSAKPPDTLSLRRNAAMDHAQCNRGPRSLRPTGYSIGSL